MTMLTSLKALLFATPVSPGVKTDAMPTDGSTDFAQILNSVGTAPTAAVQPDMLASVIVRGAKAAQDNIENQDVEVFAWRPAVAHATPPASSLAPSPKTEKPQATVQLPVALAEPDKTFAPAITAPATAIDAPVDIVPALDGEASAAAPLPQRAGGGANASKSPTPVTVASAAVTLPIKAPAAAGEAPVDIVPAHDGEASAATPLTQPAEGAADASTSPAPVTVATAAIAPTTVDQEPAVAPIKPHPARSHDAVPADPVVLSLPADMADAQDADKPSPRDDSMAFATQADSPLAQPIAPFIAPPVPVATPLVAQPDAAPAAAIQAAAAGSSPVSRSVAAPPLMTQPVSDAPVDRASLATSPPLASPPPVTPVPPAVASPDAAPMPVAAAPLPSAAAVPEASAASPLPTEAAITPTDLPVEQPVIGKPAATPAPDARAASRPAQAPPLQNVGPAPVPSAVPEAVSATPVAMPVSAGPLETGDQATDTTQANLPTAPTKPRAEAVSLLQLVRDHMSLRAPRRTETATPVRDVAPDAASAILPTALNDGATPSAALVQPTMQPVTTITTAIPTIDLSASLGAQVVDMGVSGQWIDGLARDIAGLSANGAQGRFQINADQLGPIQVDIRQGADGAAVSLTVATEAAEQALRQEGDRLKLDAGLSAMRISEVKIERAPHVAETTRADSNGNQTSSQQQSNGQGQNAHPSTGQNLGQSSAQSHMQGRGQPRENIALGHKAGSDAAVLNHTDVGESAGGAVRARYA